MSQRPSAGQAAPGIGLAHSLQVSEFEMNLDQSNPYRRTSADIIDPPTTLLETSRYLGPGFILSASIVGSGELIATTHLGAQAGFITLWVILVSCFAKVAVQLEFGRHAIATGETTMDSLNRLPGWKFGKAHWTIWAWIVLMSAKVLQAGGIVGGVALILKIFLPMVSVVWLTIFVAVVVAALVFQGHYRLIEKSSLVMIGLFTVFTLVSLGMLQLTEHAITWANLSEGLTFQLPATAVMVAIGAFGITGVGGDEIMAYNYWLIEKGYARHTGPCDDSQAWVLRAKGWIRVMYIDALLAMVVYTVVTIAFYLLGAAILNSQGLVPEKEEIVGTLSMIYTETIGQGANTVFLLGAFVVLFSTLFASLAAWTRLYSDALGQIGLYDFQHTPSRRKAIAISAWFFPASWAIVYLAFRSPSYMVIVGGLITMVILFVVMFAAIDFRYRRLDKRLKPSLLFDLWLWLSIASIAAVGIYGFAKLVI